MIFEAIAISVTDAKIASQHGADRLELITGIKEGGLTPSLGLIEGVLVTVDIPVQIMVRPHSQSFVYGEDEIRTMIRDIQKLKPFAPKAGIVLGVLTPEGHIHEEALKRMLDAAGDLEVTFHRAFDELSDQFSGLQILSQYPQIKRILTSGGKPNVMDAADRIKELVQASRKTHLAILAGSGLRAEGLADFVAGTGVTQVHFGSAVRGPGGSSAPVSAEEISKVRRILDQLSAQS